MAGTRGPLTYREAGVDIDAKDTLLAGIGSLVRTTFRDGVLNTGGEFGGLFRLTGYHDPVLVTSIDGVGTKTRIAGLLERWDVIGSDIVAHGANDVLCHGATPLFMVDYVAADLLDPGVVATIIEAITLACRRHGIALLGGETAEMPGIYKSLQVDVAGCTVGAVERDRLVTGRTIRPGDAIIGVASDGLHTNGYSLARAALLPGGGGGNVARRALARTPRGFTETLGEALLRPHRCYVRPVLDLLGSIDVRGIAHVTGGGIPGNLVRVLPEGCRASVDRARWSTPPLLAMIQRRGRIADGEMWRTFNMGLGLLLVVPRVDAGSAVALLQKAGERAWIVGEILGGSRGVDLV
ncbi:MAG TPA: phosphoribosylformylglycinamidine cyclo-ligase [bacterium]|nr:phosphoribosylformylglycinamidine cyclo-ligase [bacterium]